MQNQKLFVPLLCPNDGTLKQTNKMATSTQFIANTESIANLLMNKFIENGTPRNEAEIIVLEIIKSEDFEKIFAPMIASL